MLAVINKISERCSEGTPFKELQQVLPGLSRGQIQVLMRELRADGKVFCMGKTSVALWFDEDPSGITT